MRQQNKQSMTEKENQTLALLEKEEKEFRNHWVWKEIGLSPEEFFKKVQKHVESLNVPKAQWEAMYQKAKEANRVRALEQRTTFRSLNLKIVSGIRV